MSEKIQDFDHFADDWWNPKGRLVSLHKINPIRFDYFESAANDLIGGLSGKKVLDLGCGGGLLSEQFAGAGSLVTGIDLSARAIEVASKHREVTGGASLGIDYRLISLGDLKKEKPGNFDVIVCSEVLEHVSDLQGLIKDASSLLKKKGLFFFSTLNKTLKSRFLAIFVAEDLLGMLPQGTHDYERFIKPSELVRHFGDSGIEVLELKGISYNPLKLAFYLSGDTSVNYMGYGVKG